MSVTKAFYRLRLGNCFQLVSSRCCAHFVAGRCASSPSSRTAPTSATYWTTSGWIQSRSAPHQHAGRLCGASVTRRWAMVPTLSQIGMKRPNRCRTLRSISASVGSVGKGVVAAVLPTLRGSAELVAAQNGSYRKISGNWPRAITQADSNMQAFDVPNVCDTCAHAVGFPIRSFKITYRLSA
jgi:hypothetical protein